MNITIEKASYKDAEAILEYIKQIGGETDNLSFGAEGLPITVKEEINYLKRITNSHDNVMFVAKIDGKIIGDASLSRLPRRMQHRGDLGISVLCEYWNQGIGSQLLSAIINYAKVNSFKIIDLQVRTDNTSAIHLYEKFGFKKIGTHKSFFIINNDEIAFDYMYLKL